MTLKAIAAYDEVVIQCHDAPDPDTIACGFALWRFLTDKGVKVRLIYAGAQMTKPNVVLMVKALDIPLEHVSDLPRAKLLITVDCQYGAGNVTRFECDRFAVFDHHKREIPDSDDLVIFPRLGSCSTLIWNLLRKEGFNFADNATIATALVYGLITDTFEGAESLHPLDRDLAEFKGADMALIKKLKNSALTMDDLKTVALALSSSQLVGSIGALQSDACDPNLLGFACDIAKQVERFDCCVVYAPQNAGIKLSIRSSVRETMANELAAYITEDVGNGGGNSEKAGGYISLKALAGVSPMRFITDKIREYQSSYQLIYSNQRSIDFASMPSYRKLPIAIGFAPTTDIFNEGEPICIRTLEGDVDTYSSKDIYLMIGTEGEIYPILKSRFEASYAVLPDPYSLATEYEPTIINKSTGEKKLVVSSAKCCVARVNKIIRAAPLSKNAKLFTVWDTEKYFCGKVGDYIAAPIDDFNDPYIVKRDIFHKTYERI
ncbi:MAG: DHH family phosphoesterase [Helicobacteraceae bacterium]|jgi:phosphoglycolate phosphatase|nr:DHH family phosphoesterase [Helicobacteraceae bacterium]